MFRLSVDRLERFLFAMLLTFFLTGCGSSVEKTPTNTATGNPSNGASRAKLNLNTASESDFLAAIPGLGNRMVHEFEEYRPYRSIQQFRKEMEKYVAPKQIAEYETYVFVPIDENEADAATLQQIPGVDAAEAESLIAGRPYASREAFLAKLAEKISEADLPVAKTYLSSK